MKDDANAISTEGEAQCECCGERKPCRMYVLQNGEAAFVCMGCRFPGGVRPHQEKLDG